MIAQLVDDLLIQAQDLLGTVLNTQPTALALVSVKIQNAFCNFRLLLSTSAFCGTSVFVLNYKPQFSFVFPAASDPVLSVG